MKIKKTVLGPRLDCGGLWVVPGTASGGRSCTSLTWLGTGPGSEREREERYKERENEERWIDGGSVRIKREKTRFEPSIEAFRCVMNLPSRRRSVGDI